MKRIFTLFAALCIMLTSFSQNDTIPKQNTPPPDDTIRVGGMIIIRKAGKNKEISDKEYKMRTRRGDKPSNLTTNWWIFDLGFSSFSDNTNYSSIATQNFAPGSNKSWFELKDGKSRNVNIWFFMQKLNVVKHVVNLKYGLGIELNNYHFEQPVLFLENTLAIPNPPRVVMDNTVGRKYEKNKLAADYLTVPIMLNFNFTPTRKKGFGISGGVSAGYLYSARNKTKTNDDGKEKTKDDFELEKWKISYIAELALGPVRFYGSYAATNMFERGLDMTPYNFGFRFSNW